MSDYNCHQQQQQHTGDSEVQYYPLSGSPPVLTAAYDTHIAAHPGALPTHRVHPQYLSPATHTGLDTFYPTTHGLPARYVPSNTLSATGLDLDPTRVYPEPPSIALNLPRAYPTPSLLAARRNTIALGGSHSYDDVPPTHVAAEPNSSAMVGSAHPASLVRPTVGSDRTSQTAHERRHPDTPANYVCEYCGKDFTKRHNYEGHKNSHEGKRPYRCMYCDQGFARQSDCRRHEQEYCPRRRSNPSPSA